MDMEERIKDLENASSVLMSKFLGSELRMLESERRILESERRMLESERRIIEAERGIIGALSYVTRRDFPDAGDKFDEALERTNQQINSLNYRIGLTQQ